MQRKNISSGSPYESVAGYSRAVRLGQFVYVAGTTASDSEGKVHGIGNIYFQTKYVFQKIEAALKQADSELDDIVRTRMFVTDISTASEVMRAHNEIFHDIRPAATLVQVSAFVSKEMLIEIEVDAVIKKKMDGSDF